MLCCGVLMFDLRWLSVCCGLVWFVFCAVVGRLFMVFDLSDFDYVCSVIVDWFDCIVFVVFSKFGSIVEIDS